MQIDYEFPDGETAKTAREDHVPSQGDLMTWHGEGDYIVVSVHYTMQDNDNGTTRISCATVTLTNDPSGRQHDEWV